MVPAADPLEAHLHTEPGRYRVAMLAPPWIPVPPSGYGGIESVIALLCRALVTHGHRVTLYAAPGSRSCAEVVEPLPRSFPEGIGRALYEVDHVARALDAVDEWSDRGDPFDLIHDHSGYTAVAMADRVSVPVVHTLHGAFTDDVLGFYRRHTGKAHLVALSEAQRRSAPDLPIVATVPNPVDVSDWPFKARKEDYVLSVGRMTAEKGPHRAISAARAAGVRLILAGPVQPGQEEFFRREVAPFVDPYSVQYVGEIGGERKKALFARARALLMPIRWEEPFGMVMVEALACGTPVIAFPEGAAVDIVQDGYNGYLAHDEEAMAAAVGRLDRIDPADCRRSVAARFDLDAVAAGYERVYRRAVSSRRVASAQDLGRLSLLGAVRPKPRHPQPLVRTSPPRTSTGQVEAVTDPAAP
jgi:glycosyltransferase involved in cell wall biosynthesis